jgi:hypothetical protein
MKRDDRGHRGSTGLATRFARRLAAAILILALVGTAGVAPAGDNLLVGTWKLKSFVREDVASGERKPALGEHPEGYLGLRARWAHVCAIRRRRPRGSRRRPAYGCGARATAQVRVAYGGTYTIASDKVIHHIDIAWNNARFGSDQVRFFNLDGEKLTLTTERNKSPIDGSEGFGVLEFEQ